MRLQSTQANCGPASLHNALAALGIARTEDELATLCRTTGTEGTSPKNMMKAIRALGRAPEVINERRLEVGLLWVEAWLREGRPVILCVDQSSHWVTAIGIMGKRVMVADSADNELVVSYSRAELVERWESDGRFYGIVV
jgi:ABC-type bacteriocin/lantibiotic exporter with double-glycine peptidase domain